MYSDANMLLKLVESMKNPSGTEVLQKGTNYYYDANGNQTVQESSYIKPNHPSLQEKFSATAIGDDEVVFDNIIDYVRNTFDGFDRLKRVESVKSGVRTVTEFDYNGDDLRVKKTVKKSSNNYVPEVTNYLYDGQYVVLETDSSDNVKARYIRGINYIARVDASNKVSCFLYNGHGDVVQTVNEAGTIENQYDYDIFGSVTLAIEVSYSCSIRYAGEFYDGETGLYYLRARYYNPYIGRFISEDSYLGEDSDPLSLNLYAYCSNNPIMYTDPTGHWQQGDEKLNQTSRIEISRLTDLYVSATTKAEKDKIHAAAEAIRNNSANIATTPQNSVTGQKANSILSTTSNKDSNGTYMTASQWNAISTTKNDAIVKQTINNGITQAEINTVAASKPTQSVTPNGNTNSGGSNAISTVINETIRVSSTPWGYDGPPPAGYVPNAYAIEGTGNSTTYKNSDWAIKAQTQDYYTRNIVSSVANYIPVINIVKNVYIKSSGYDPIGNKYVDAKEQYEAGISSVFDTGFLVMGGTELKGLLQGSKTVAEKSAVAISTTSAETRQAVQELLKKPIQDAVTGQFIKKAGTQVNNALKNVGTSTKDITQETLNSQMMKEIYEQLKSSSEAESINDAIEVLVKAITRNKK